MTEWHALGLPTLTEIQVARTAMSPWAWQTPLLRLDPTGPAGAALRAAGIDVYLKLENLQAIGAFKIRGAASLVARLSDEELSRGLVTASAGNMAQAVAWLARERGVSCTVIVPETAPEVKVSAVRDLGATVLRVAYEEWWSAFEQHGHAGVQGTFVHAFDDPAVMAGNGVIALEVLEQLPDTDAILIPWGGGGLTCGVAAAVKGLGSRCRVYACEVEDAAPLAAALEAGVPKVIDYRPSFVDGIGSHSVFPQMLERARGIIAGSLVTPVSDVARAVLMLAARNHVIAEGAGACPVAAAAGGMAGPGKIVCVVSGGNIELSELQALASG